MLSATVSKHVIGLGIVGLVVLAVSAGVAGERDELQGFDRFSLSMSEEALRASTIITEEKPEEGKLRLTSSETFRIGELAYEISFLIDEGELYRINLSNNTPESDIRCEARFKRNIGLVSARYGPPDQPPERSEHGVDGTVLGVINAATFTFKDAGRLQVSATFVVPDHCSNSVVYTRGSSGDTATF